MKTKLFLILLILPFVSLAQGVTSTIRGIVIDAFTHSPVEGANVVLLDSLKQKGTITDAEGNFSLTDVPVGRKSVGVTFVGYKPWIVRNIIVSSGKEVLLIIKLEDDAQQIAEVLITTNRKLDTKNSYNYVSGRNFNVEDTERYSGTNGDPARMATYFAGVMAAGDTRNDIIIRGNSPLGLLWRVEGVDIPNPSHFASMGTNGGAMSILNNNQLANSDFLSGAFPAQYGNALSGVFDLHLRSGNNQKRETTIQMGTGGLEAGIEGYFSTNSQASYLVNLRYSFIELFGKLGIDFQIPTIPKYQDISFKFDLPTRTAGRFSLWGLGGLSTMEMLAENNTMHSTKNINTQFGSSMGVAGLSHSYTISENTFIKTSFAVNGFETAMRVDSVDNLNEVKHFYGNKYNELRYVATSVFRHKLSSKTRFEVGATFTNNLINYNDSARFIDSYIYLAQNSGAYNLFKTFGQFELKISPKVKISSGINYIFLGLNGSSSVEPRLAINFDATKNTSVYLGQGLHSQVQQGNIYFHKTLVETTPQVYKETNRNLDFTKSYHSVLGVKQSLNPFTQLKFEAYYQYLYNVPVEVYPSAYSIINLGADYYNQIEDSLVNGGVGRNIGFELTLEQTYTKGFYYLLNLSIYDSKYKGSDNIWRSTMYNGNFIVNMLGGYEIKLPKNESLAINANLVWAGGLRYTPIDIEKSIDSGQTVLSLDNPYSQKHKDFFKANIKLLYRINRAKFSYESGFGISNITNRKNVLMQSFDAENAAIAYDYQLGLMPEGIFRIYF